MSEMLGSALGPLAGGRTIAGIGNAPFRGIPPSGTRGVSGLRRPASNELSPEDIARLTREFQEVGGDPSMLRFNQGSQTGFVDKRNVINVRGDVMPAEWKNHPRSLMSSRAALAHELGHAHHRNMPLKPGAWNDEFRASYWAAKNAPGLTDEEKALLMSDAVERAREANVPIRLNRFMREILYGY